jgi:MFS family permease
VLTCMTEDSLNITDNRRLRSMVALHAVSMLAQIGQFALGSILLPIALEAKKVSPEVIGFTSAAFWLGMLAGLLVVGYVSQKIGYRNTVIVGLLMSAASFIMLPLIDWRWWAVLSAAIGFGTGLRWIASETWLYRLAPVETRGRVVGIQETLIGLAQILGPLIIVLLGASKPSAFWAAAAIIMVGIFPLFIAIPLPAGDTTATSKNLTATHLSQFSFKRVMLLLSYGGFIAGIGGWLEGSLIALLPVYNTDIGLLAADTAWLLTILGVGLMLFQYPVGWLADTKGVNWTAKLSALIGLAGILIAMIFGTHFFALAIALFLLGGVSGGLLTLGIVWATQRSKGAELSNSLRQVSITYTLLSAIGPLVAGFVVSYIGSDSLFWQQLVMIFVLAIVLLKQKVQIKAAT